MKTREISSYFRTFTKQFMAIKASAKKRFGACYENDGKRLLLSISIKAMPPHRQSTAKVPPKNQAACHDCSNTAHTINEMAAPHKYPQL